MSHPYQQFEGTQLWREVDAVITALEANQDLQLTTARSHVIGALCKQLFESGIVSADAVLPE